VGKVASLAGTKKSVAKAWGEEEGVLGRKGGKGKDFNRRLREEKRIMDGKRFRSVRVEGGGFTKVLEEVQEFKGGGERGEIGPYLTYRGKKGHRARKKRRRENNCLIH